MPQISSAVADETIAKPKISYVILAIGAKPLFATDVVAFTLVEHIGIDHLCEVVIDGIRARGRALRFQRSADSTHGERISDILHDEFGGFEEDAFIADAAADDDVSCKDGVEEAAVDDFCKFGVFRDCCGWERTNGEILIECFCDVAFVIAAECHEFGKRQRVHFDFDVPSCDVSQILA